MPETLAIMGGDPIIKGTLPTYKSIGECEIAAVLEVLESGNLSGFFGSPGEKFLGGPKVREFERLWSETFNVKHTISMNSATSGLYASMGAIGISPGDEVIVPPFTMSATVMAPLIYGGIPVFADIEPETFCLNPTSVEQLITTKTKAIIAVNLFGHPAELSRLKSIAERNNLWLIEDNAQGPLSMEGDSLCGTIGDIGIFSLNYHKHIHTGEGGMCLTNDDELAQRLQLIRNHGENVIEDKKIGNLNNMVGFNYRMTELSAAVGIAQLSKIHQHVTSRESAMTRLSSELHDLEGLTPPVVREDCRHVYYQWALRFNEELIGVSREVFSKALEAEGFPHFLGYVEPLYLLPVFQNLTFMGDENFPFNLGSYEYKKGLCPVAEDMYENQLILFEPCPYDLTDELVSKLIKCVRRVYENRNELRVRF